MKLISFLFLFLSPLSFAKTQKTQNNPVVILTTNKGEIQIELNNKLAPKSTENFISYVKSGHYNGTIFHRVIDSFMIQGGGFDKDLQEKKTKKSIINEADNRLDNEEGTVAMARTSDPHSASSQFFINVANNTFLNHRSKDTAGWGYAVFGKVIKGMDVVNKIKKSATQNKKGMQDVPIDNIIIEKSSLK